MNSSYKNLGSKGNSGTPGLQGLKGDKGDSGNNGVDGSQGIQGPVGNNLTIYYHYPVHVAVVEQDIVMNIINNGNGQAPLSFKQATNGGNSYYPAIYGVAKNVSGGFADIYVGKNAIVPGFNFGVFIGVEYYLDPANPGKLTWTPPNTGSSVNPMKIGRALDANNLILDPIGNFLQLKGSLYVSDGSYDDALDAGANGQALIANSAATYGVNWAASIVAAAPFTYTSSTRTLTIATATNSVPGVMSASDHALLHNAVTIGTANGLSLSTQALSLAAATSSVNGALTSTDWTTFNNKQAGPLTGDVTTSGAAATISATTVTGKLITGFVSGSGTVAATDTILQAINKLNGNITLKSPLASPVFTGDVNSSTGNLLVSTIGKGLQVKTGANSKIGTAVLSAGTVTVSNTSVTANSLIFLTSQVNGGTPGFLRITAKTAATSFVITSSSNSDTSTVAWMIVESIP